MNTSISIIIPTCLRSELLDRTLKSISEFPVPEAIKELIIVENGKQLGAERIANENRARVPIKYIHSPNPNKSSALNIAIDSTDSRHAIFFDDDIRVSKTTLQTYVDFIKSAPTHYFAGGKCLVDYEEKPPEWIRQYLPPSAKGWTLGDSLMPLTTPEALGFNWAASISTIRDLGGFNPNRGPGTNARGQESDMQIRMLNNGIKGTFLPAATVWHYVPKERCSPEWTLKRSYTTAQTCGQELNKKNQLNRLRHLIQCKVKNIYWRFAGAMSTNERKRFQAKYMERWNQGIIDGAKRAPWLIEDS